MKDIDFLPARYRERDQLRRAIVWRLATLAVSLLVVVGVHLTQVFVRNNLQAELGTLKEPYVRAMDVSVRLQRLRTELKSNQLYAELVTYLEHPWPRTQLLAAITQTLPSTLTLADVKIVQQSAPRTGPPQDPAEVARIPAVRRDLTALRSEFEPLPCEVLITGTAADTSAVHTYAAGFNDSAFFTSAKLESIESLKDRDAVEGSRFVLRLVVRPGYGQANGPPAKTAVQPAVDRTALRTEKGRP